MPGAIVQVKSRLIDREFFEINTVKYEGDTWEGPFITEVVAAPANDDATIVDDIDPDVAEDVDLDEFEFEGDEEGFDLPEDVEQFNPA